MFFKKKEKEVNTKAQEGLMNNSEPIIIDKEETGEAHKTNTVNRLSAYADKLAKTQDV